MSETYKHHLPRKGDTVETLFGSGAVMERYTVIGWSPTQNALVVKTSRGKRTHIYVRTMTLTVNDEPTQVHFYEPTGLIAQTLYPSSA